MKLLKPFAAISLLFVFFLFNSTVYGQAGDAGKVSTGSITYTDSSEKVYMYWIPPLCLTREYTWMSDSIASFIEGEVKAYGNFDIYKEKMYEADSAAEVRTYIDSVLSLAFDKGKGYATTGWFRISGERKVAKRCACYQGVDTTMDVTNDTSSIILVRMHFYYDLVNLETGAKEARKVYTGRATSSNIHIAAMEAYKKLWKQLSSEWQWLLPEQVR